MGRIVHSLSVGLGLLLSGRKAMKGIANDPRPESNRTRDDVAPARQQKSPARPSGAGGYFKAAFKGFNDDDCMTQGAAIAYYTVFSLPSLLLIIVAVVGLFLGREAVQGQLQQQIQGLIGQGAGSQVQAMVSHANQHHGGGIVSTVIGIIALLFGASGAFIALQQALNRAWQVKPDPNRSTVKDFLSKRLLSIAMILGIGFLLLVSLALSAAVSALGAWAGAILPKALTGPLLRVLTAAVSFVVTFVLFGAIFKVLPDVQIRWKDVWVGAVITAALFTVGKEAIGYYVGKSGTASAYGAAGSLMVIVLWIYYASLIVLFGAEFTQVWAEAHGHALQPDKGAMRVVQEERPAA